MRVARVRRRDSAALEARHLRAAELFRTGTQHQAAIARELGVSRQSVSRWYRAWRRDGVVGLRRVRRPGRKPRLSQVELLQLQASLRRGPQFCGQREAARWTLMMIAALSKHRFGIAYHPRHIPYLLRVNRITLPSPTVPAA